MNERLREALRRKISAHNRFVWITTVWSVVAVAFMWLAIYFIARWVIVLGATVIKGLDATMPGRFDRGFAIAVIVLLIVGWIARRRGFWSRVREEKAATVILLELLLLPTRATFATVHGLRKLIRLSDDHLHTAADFLVRVVRAGRVVETDVPLEMPEEAARARVLHALEVLDLIYLRKSEGEASYSVADPQRLLPFL
ncbi:MAG: hypothetical protein ABMA13_10405 [Chthoniobacteraceae bacterium]